MELLGKLRTSEGDEAGNFSHNADKEENINKDGGILVPNRAQKSVAVQKMTVAEYLQAVLNPSVSLPIVQTTTTKIGNTVFLINGRLLTPQENFLSGKLDSAGYSRYPYIWSNKPFHQQNEGLNNIAPYESGAIGAAREVKSELDTFYMFITEKMMQNILTHTNEEIRLSEYYILPKSTCAYPLSLAELKAFIGILFLSAVKKDNKVPTSFLWGVSGSYIYNTVMSKERFEFLLRCLRFDEYSTRNLRKKRDSFTEIKDFWNDFFNKCAELYRPTVKCVIDEMFLDFNGNCNFKWPLPRQPRKCGIKLILLCDAGNRYIISGLPHLDKNKNGTIPLAEFIVEKLTAPLWGTNSKITLAKEWFVSIPLSKKMLNVFKIATVGILQDNQPGIPPDMMLEENRPVGTSIFVYNTEDKLQLCSHYPKKREINIFLSNMHFDTVIDGPECKPQVASYYESTKDGVEAIIKMAHGSSCTRLSTHWFLTIFLCVLDFAGINSFTIFNLNRSRYGKPLVRRLDFLYKLALDLMLPFIKERQNDPITSDTIKDKIKSILEERQNMDPNDLPKYKDQDKKIPIKINSANFADQPNSIAELGLQAKISPTNIIKQETQIPPCNTAIELSETNKMWSDIRSMYSPAPEKQNNSNISDPTNNIIKCINRERQEMNTYNDLPKHTDQDKKSPSKIISGNPIYPKFSSAVVTKPDDSNISDSACNIMEYIKRERQKMNQFNDLPKYTDQDKKVHLNPVNKPILAVGLDPKTNISPNITIKKQHEDFLPDLSKFPSTHNSVVKLSETHQHKEAWYLSNFSSAPVSVIEEVQPRLLTEPYRPMPVVRPFQTLHSFAPPRNVQFQPIVPYINYINVGLIPGILYIQEIYGPFGPATSVIPLQWMPHLEITTYYLPNIITDQRVQDIHSNRPALRPILPARPVQKMQPDVPTQNKATILPSQPAQSFKAVTATKVQERQLKRLEILPHKLSQYYQNIKSNPLNAYQQITQPILPIPPSYQCDLPMQASQNPIETASKLKIELCVCGVCNYIGNKNFFTECSSCSIKLCMVHRKVICTKCHYSIKSSVIYSYMPKRAKCGLCIPRGKIRYSAVCCKCSRFLCLDHRRMVCLFCIEM